MRYPPPPGPAAVWPPPPPSSLARRSWPPAAASPPPARPGSPASNSPAPVKPKVSLTITVVNGPTKPITHWTLTCDPAGGTHPDPAAACAALAAIKQPFAVTKVGVACPMIVASARRATFSGTYFGAPVNRTIIDGGCDLAHWSQLGQVVN